MVKLILPGDLRMIRPRHLIGSVSQGRINSLGYRDQHRVATIPMGEIQLERSSANVAYPLRDDRPSGILGRFRNRAFVYWIGRIRLLPDRLGIFYTTSASRYTPDLEFHVGGSRCGHHLSIDLRFLTSVAN
jgi:hypothetical protein